MYRKKESLPETKFKEILSRLRINSDITQWYVPENSEKFYEIDFALDKIKIGFEINGNQHYCKNGKLKVYYKNRQEYLEKLGWKIINIHYLKCFHEEELKSIILSSISGDCQFSQNNISNILRHKDIIRKRKIKEKQQKKQQQILLRKKEINEKIQLVLNSNIDFSKFGWVDKVATLISILPQKTSSWFKSNMADFYKNNCFKRQRAISSIG